MEQSMHTQQTQDGLSIITQYCILARSVDAIKRKISTTNQEQRHNKTAHKRSAWRKRQWETEWDNLKWSEHNTKARTTLSRLFIKLSPSKTKTRAAEVVWRSPNLSSPRIMFSKCVCYDFFNRFNKCHKIECLEEKDYPRLPFNKHEMNINKSKLAFLL